MQRLLTRFSPGESLNCRHGWGCRVGVRTVAGGSRAQGTVHALVLSPPLPRPRFRPFAKRSVIERQTYRQGKPQPSGCFCDSFNLVVLCRYCYCLPRFPSSGLLQLVAQSFDHPQPHFRMEGLPAQTVGWAGPARLVRVAQRELSSVRRLPSQAFPFYLSMEKSRSLIAILGT